MEQVIGYEEYRKEFCELALPEYRWLAYSILSEAIQSSHCEYEGIINVYMTDCISKDNCCYTFQFSFHVMDWNNPYIKSYNYIGCY